MFARNSQVQTTMGPCLVLLFSLAYLIGNWIELVPPFNLQRACLRFATAMLKLPSCLVLILLTSRFVSVLSATAEDWSTRSIYQVFPLSMYNSPLSSRAILHQVMTDRFATSDDDKTPCDTSARKYCGGSWQGITNHLDYIQNMGFDAVWISPVSANVEGVTSDGEAFHG